MRLEILAMSLALVVCGICIAILGRRLRDTSNGVAALIACVSSMLAHNQDLGRRIARLEGSEP